MLSIGAMGSGQCAYYSGLAREDYYLDGGEPPGIWHGKGAAALGLDGTVGREELENLFKGFAPDGSAALVQLQRGKTHQPGWDLTFSAPKSVSVLWSVADVELRVALQQAHFRAVKFALDYLESTAAFTRRGHGGVNREQCGLVVAMFEHGTSRAQEQQLHTHALAMNVVAREDGSFGTLVSHNLYLHKMVAGVLYRVQLAYECTRLGLELVRGKHSFELAGVPNEVCEAASTRRHQVLEALAREGLSGAAAASLAALSTRQVKGHVARKELFGHWRELARELGFSSEQAMKLVAVVQPEILPLSVLHLHTGKAVDALTTRQSHFSEADLLQRVAHALEHSGISGQDVLGHVRDYLEHGSNTEAVRERAGFVRYATKTLIAAEKELLVAARRSIGDRSHIVSNKTVDAVAGSRTLNPEQLAAFRRITTHAGSIQCIEGMAGTGKTYLLDAAREAWEKDGYRVIGCALAARAARQLESDSGIKSATLKSTLWRISPPLADRIEHARKKFLAEAKRGFRMDVRGMNAKAKAKVRKAVRKRDQPLGGLKLDKKTIVVLDEAGMVDSVQFNKLSQHVTKAGAKLVCGGDRRQVQPIEAGAPFASVAEVVGSVRLTEVIRQRHEWMREAVHHFADGDARTGLSLYAKEGKLHVAQDRDAAMTTLVATWDRRRTADLSETLILAGTRGEVRELNLLAQYLRRIQSELGSRSIMIGGTTFFEGDRVLFMKNNRAINVLNGDFGVVENIRGVISSPITPVVIRLDQLDKRGNPIRVTFTPAQYKDLTLGYAATVHKTQGATLDRIFALVGGWMQDRELSYVQMSRHREDCRLFASKADAGEDLVELARSMSRSRAKETAVEVPRQPEQEIAR